MTNRKECEMGQNSWRLQLSKRQNLAFARMVIQTPMPLRFHSLSSTDALFLSRDFMVSLLNDSVSGKGRYCACDSRTLNQRH